MMASLLPAQQKEEPVAPNNGPYSVKPQSLRQEQILVEEAPEDTVASQIKHFFKDMFKTVKFGGIRGKYIGTAIKLEPEKEVVLKDHRDFVVQLAVVNKTGRMLKLDFPTSQRIEILLRDSAGNVVERWSEDQAFSQVAGVVTINPNERIEYRERISTREMKAGEKYTVEATLFNYPEHNDTAPITAK